MDQSKAVPPQFVHGPPVIGLPRDQPGGLQYLDVPGHRLTAAPGAKHEKPPMYRTTFGEAPQNLESHGMP